MMNGARISLWVYGGCVCVKTFGLYCLSLCLQTAYSVVYSTVCVAEHSTVYATFVILTGSVHSTRGNVI